MVELLHHLGLVRTNKSSVIFLEVCNLYSEIGSVAIVFGTENKDRQSQILMTTKVREIRPAFLLPAGSKTTSCLAIERIVTKKVRDTFYRYGRNYAGCGN